MDVQNPVKPRYDSSKETVSQTFSLPPPIILHVSKVPVILEKLQLTCRQFYQPLPLIHKLSNDNQTKTHSYQQSLFIRPHSSVHLEVPGCHVTNVLIISLGITDKYDLTMKTILPKIVKCSVKLLSFWGQYLSISEFAFLATSVKDLSLSDSYIHESNNARGTLDRIIQNAPKAKKF